MTIPGYWELKLTYITQAQGYTDDYTIAAKALYNAGIPREKAAQYIYTCAIHKRSPFMGVFQFITTYKAGER